MVMSTRTRISPPPDAIRSLQLLRRHIGAVVKKGNRPLSLLNEPCCYEVYDKGAAWSRGAREAGLVVPGANLGKHQARPRGAFAVRPNPQLGSAAASWSLQPLCPEGLVASSDCVQARYLREQELARKMPNRGENLARKNDRNTERLDRTDAAGPGKQTGGLRRVSPSGYGTSRHHGTIRVADLLDLGELFLPTEQQDPGFSHTILAAFLRPRRFRTIFRCLHRPVWQKDYHLGTEVIVLEPDPQCLALRCSKLGAAWLHGWDLAGLGNCALFRNESPLDSKFTTIVFYYDARGTSAPPSATPLAMKDKPSDQAIRDLIRFPRRFVRNSSGDERKRC
ncbi:hypothetical protein MAPG_11884 [Magnaporthiopsis poae ATCC 64411]|uniref:Uncharacterized protein n=1 Tax=Magnaporthiopsis poae (strain ATCC 64411 / 73-15) TaxID=644358 RepID=A0A0C4EGE7_MAGP6|nr:hypothetical protein MAPG_11884 [Magnaporthiopsis poae ATCC 64411]